MENQWVNNLPESVTTRNQKKGPNSYVTWPISLYLFLKRFGGGQTGVWKLEVFFFFFFLFLFSLLFGKGCEGEKWSFLGIFLGSVGTLLFCTGSVFKVICLLAWFRDWFWTLLEGLISRTVCFFFFVLFLTSMEVCILDDGYVEARATT